MASFFETVPTSAATSALTPDYSGLDPKQAVKSATFLQDLREHYREVENTDPGSDEDLLRRFFRDRRFSTGNLVVGAVDLAKATGLSDDQKSRYAKLKKIYDGFPDFWEEGGRGAVEAITDYAVAGVTDPTNLIGGGAAFNAAKLAIQSGKSFGGAVLRGLGKGLVADAPINAVASAAGDLIEQGIEKQIGMRETLSAGQAATAAGAGAVLGGAISAPLVALGAAAGARAGARELASAAPTTAAAPPAPGSPPPPAPATPNAPAPLTPPRTILDDALDHGRTQLEADPNNAELAQRQGVMETLASWPARRAVLLKKIETAMPDEAAALNAEIAKWDMAAARAANLSGTDDISKVIDGLAGIEEKQPEAGAGAPPKEGEAASQPGAAPKAEAAPAAAQQSAAPDPYAGITSRKALKDYLVTAGYDEAEASSLARTAGKEGGDREGRATAYQTTAKLATIRRQVEQLRDAALLDASEVAGGTDSFPAVLKAAEDARLPEMERLAEQLGDGRKAEDLFKSAGEPAVAHGTAGRVATGDAEIRAYVEQQAEDAARQFLPLRSRKLFVDFMKAKMEGDLFGDDAPLKGRREEIKRQHIEASTRARAAEVVDRLGEDTPRFDNASEEAAAVKRALSGDNTRVTEDGNVEIGADALAKTAKGHEKAPVIDRVTGADGTERVMTVSGRSLTESVDPKTGQSTFRQLGGVQGILKGSNNQGFAGPPLREKGGEISQGRDNQAKLTKDAEEQTKLAKLFRQHDKGVAFKDGRYFYKTALQEKRRPEATAAAQAAVAGDDVRLGELMRMLAAAKQGTAAAPTATPAAQALPEGRVLAIQGKDGYVRVLSDKQVGAGLNNWSGVAALAGKSPVDSFTVGTVPAGAKSGHNAAFTPREAVIADAPPAKLPEVLPEMKGGLELPPAYESVKDAPVQVGGKVMTVEEMHRTLSDIEARPLRNMDEAKLAVEQMMELLPHMPEVRLPQSTRSRSLRRLELIMGRADARSQAAIKDILYRLAGESGPRWREAEVDQYVAHGDPKTINTIGLAKSGDTPVVFRVLHEVGHWSWSNLMTNEQKQDFLRHISSTYFGNADDMASFAQMVARDSVTPSIAEFWANQWEMFVSQKVRRGEMGDFWKEIAGTNAALVDRMTNIDDSLLDQQIVQRFFSKILPDAALDKMSEKLLGSKQPNTKQGAQTAKYLSRFTLLSDELEQAIAEGNVPAIVEALAERPGDNLKGLLFGFGRSTDDRYGGSPLGAKAAQTSNRVHRYYEEWKKSGGEPDVAQLAGDEAFIDGAVTLAGQAEKDWATMATDALVTARDVIDHLGSMYQNLERATPPQPEPRAPKSQERHELARELRVRGERRQNQRKAEAERAANAEVTRARGEREAPVKADPEITTAPASLTEAALIKQVKALDPNGDAYRTLSFEIHRRIASAPTVKAVRVPADVAALSEPGLRRELMAALAENNTGRVDQISYELWRREGDIFKPQSPQVQSAIAREIDSSAGIQRQDGINPRGPATLQVLQSAFSARDPVVANTQRQLMARMWNLLDGNLKRDAEAANVFDLEALHRLTGTPMPAGARGGFIDLSDPAFTRLKREVRKVAIGLSGDANPLDLMHELSHMAWRTLDDDTRNFVMDAYQRAVDPVKEHVEKSYAHLDMAGRAAEWYADGAANYIGERVAKGDIFRHNLEAGTFNLTMKNGLERLLDTVREMIAYLVNGLVGNKSMKQVYRQLTWYGDMLKVGRPDKIVDAAPSPLISPSAAGAMASGKSAAYRKRVREFVGGGAGSKDGEPILLYHATPMADKFDDGELSVGLSQYGEAGKGFYVSDDPSGAGYAEMPTRGAWLALISKSGLDEATAVRATSIANEIVDSEREYIALHRTLDSPRGVFDGFEFLTREDRQRAADTLLEQISFAREELDALGVKPQPDVLPVYIRMTNPLDMRGDTVYRTTDLLNPNTSVGRWMEAVGREAGEPLGDLSYNEILTGSQVWDAALNILVDNDDWGAQNKAQSIAQRLGFDGIIQSHSKPTLDPYGGVDHDHRYTAYSVFTPNQVKHADARYFNEMDPRFYYALDGADVNLGGAMATAIADGQAPRIQNAISVAQVADKLGAAGPVGRMLSDILGGRGTSAALDTARKFSYPFQLRTNASRIAEFVSPWLAAKIKPDQGVGHFEQVTSATAAKLAPIFEGLSSLPGGESWRQALREMRPWGDVPQSDGEAKVLRALRRQHDPKEIASLSADERAIFNRVTDALSNMLAEMRDVGMSVGKIANGYFPQVWDNDKLAKDKERAIRGFTRYFMAEAENDPNVGAIGLTEAMEKAANVVQRLSEERGVYLPTEAVRNAAGKGENLDFQRLIRLEQPWAKAALGELEPFLVNNLRATLTKYFHEATKRVSLTERFGIRNHVVDDYLTGRLLGKEGVREVLSNGKTMYRAIKGVVDGAVETGRQELPVVPALSQDAANTLTDAIYQMAAEGGNQTARIADEIAAAYAGADQSVAPHVRRRAEAIAQGISDNVDGAYKPLDIADDELRFLDGFLGHLDGRSVLSGPFIKNISQVGQKLRAVNNVRLLGMTTLTSFTDPIMPLIRSGDLGSTIRGFAKWATDKESRAAMRNIGVGMDSLIQQHLAMMYGVEENRVSNAFFRMNGLTTWTNFMREATGVIGWESLKAAQRRAVGNLGPDGRGNLSYRTSARFLRELGLEDYVPTPERRDVPSLDSEALFQSDERIRRALIRFTDDSIFAPNANDIPLWAQTVPFMPLIFQLKSFPLMAGRLAKHSLKEAREGNPWPAAYALTIGAGLSAGVQSLKDVVQFRGGDKDEGPQPKLRDRSLSKMAEELGLPKPGMSEEGDQLLGWFLQSFLQLGVTGLVFDSLYQTAQQADNGAFGWQRAMSVFFGPSVGLASDGFNVTAGALAQARDMAFGDDGKNGAERNALRTVAGYVPIAGSFRNWREASADLGGEPGKKKKGGSGPFGSGPF